jgi:hypothetical protein
MTITRAQLSVLVLAVVSAAGCYYGSSTSEAPNPSLGGDTATANPPAQAGRIDFIEGAVSFRPAEADTWAFAELNRTVTTGDRLWVDTVGHAELEVGANAVRVGPETEVDAVRIDDDMLQLRVPQGVVNVRIRGFDENADYEVDAPNAAITMTKAGDYRVDVSPDGATTKVTVHSGQAQVTSAGATFQVTGQQTATIQGDSATTYDIAPAAGPDAFDDWTLSRDAREDRPSVSTRYVSPDMGGVADLDDAGAWTQNTDYGPVWFPSGVAVGWAPYSFGHWVWIGPWGWTWVDDAPWGWAPFHYGRWAFIGGAWGWCPGSVIYTPVYAPALVAFVGGGGWAFGVGWFPLGPREPWFPPYRTDLGYRQRVNVTNITNVTEVRNPNPAFPYRNRTVPGAVSAVPEHTFTGGDQVSHALQHPGPSELATARTVAFTPGVAPTRASLAAGLGRAASIPPRTLESRSVMAIHAPPPRTIPFSEQERALATNGGRPLSTAERSSLRSQTVAASPTGSRFRSAVAAPPGRSLAPARSGLAPARPATQALFDRGGTGGSARSSLDDSYRNERLQLEQRHVQEFAQPGRPESETQLMQRQEMEHRDMQSRYSTARSSGMARMPASHFAGGGGGGRGGGGRPH